MSDLLSLQPRYVDEGVFGRCVLGFWSPRGTMARVGLITATAVNFGIFNLGSHWFGLPALPGFDGSLFHQPSPILALLSIGLLLVITTLVGTVIAGAVRFEAGLFAALLGLSAISERSGTMQSVALETGGTASIFLGLIFELLILSAMIAGLWMILWKLGKLGFVHNLYPSEPIADRVGKNDSDFVKGLTATVAQVVATAGIIMFLCRSESKNQALASVGIASVAGAFIAYKYSPTRPSVWFWAGPLLVGLVGYLIAWISNDPQWVIGNPEGTFAALARPLPIDYASVGPAAAMLGYWMAHAEPPAGET